MYTPSYTVCGHPIPATHHKTGVARCQPCQTIWLRSQHLPSLPCARPARLGAALGVSRQRAHQLMNRDKDRARNAVTRALKRGTLTRPFWCVRCKAGNVRIEAHHPDYQDRLNVVWLCPKCHMVVHPHFRRTGVPS